MGVGSLSQSGSAMNLGTPRILDPVSRDAIVSMLRQNRKIDAIKLYRLATGAGLAESKNAVEAIAAQNGIARASVPAAPLPITTILLLGIVLCVGVAIYYAKFAH